MIDPAHCDFFLAHGYVVVPALFSRAQVAAYIDHYMRLRHAGSYEGDMVSDDKPGADDPLARYPRMIHMHRWDTTSRDWMLDARLTGHLAAFFGSEPLAVQTMLYFKPPGARGQAVHQDNFYLRASPGTCAAAWMALDRADVENGCMQVVSGSHNWPILCTQSADVSTSFTNVTVPLAPGHSPIPVPMEAGDVLFFHGALVHGSFPNRSANRFRRSLIAHYIDGRARQVTAYDQPVLRTDGTELWLKESPGGGPCGIWTDRDGHPKIELAGVASANIPSHE